MKKVYGIYQNSREAKAAVDSLLRENYTRDQIRVISGPTFMTDNNQRDNYTENNQRYDYTEDDRTLWEKIKDAFTFDEYNNDYFDGENMNIEDRTLLEPYTENLKRGETIVMVDENRDDQIGTELNTDQVGSALHNRQDSSVSYKKNPKDPRKI